MLLNALNPLPLGFDKHEFQCPYCQEQTLFFLPGKTVLFAAITCQHCNREFLIVENVPRK